jgi:CO/xanthine dehydrogenase Mo-binding subunit
MSETYDILIDRRAFLTASGALLVTLAVPGDWAEGQTTGSATQPAVAGDQLDSYITIDRDGTVVAYFGRIDGGQGLETAITQMVAEEIEVSHERVRVVMGSTTVIDMGAPAPRRACLTAGCCCAERPLRRAAC